MPKPKSFGNYLQKRWRKVLKFMASFGVVEYVSAGGVIIHEGKMLLLDRPRRGETRLPKGHVDPGETVDETALRETEEESGYADLEIVEDLGARLIEFEKDDKQYRRTEHFYLMRLLSDRQVPRTPKDTEQFHPFWVPMADAVTLLTFLPEQDAALRAIAAYQKHSD